MSAVLRLENLNHYFGGLKAVSNFEAELQKGELVGLIGPNGAGKTTIFNLVTGVYAPTQGKIFFKGQDITGMKPYRIAEMGIARTFQTLRLYGSLSVLDNVTLGYHFRVNYGLLPSILRTSSFRDEERKMRERSEELLARFGLLDMAYERASSLPYGEQRRLEICRALASDPELLLLDEPAAGMNPLEVEELMNLIRWVHKEFDVTIFLIEHQMQVVMGICPRIIAMDFGEIIAEGTPEEIQNNPRVLEAYLGRVEETA